jgi:hypothetical protein
MDGRYEPKRSIAERDSCATTDRSLDLTPPKRDWTAHFAPIRSMSVQDVPYERKDGFYFLRSEAAAKARRDRDDMTGFASLLSLEYVRWCGRYAKQLSSIHDLRETRP